MTASEQFSKQVEQEVRRALLNITGRDTSKHGQLGNAQTGFKKESRLRSIPPPQIYPDGSSSQGSTLVTKIGPDGSGNYTWQVDDIDIFSSFDRNGGDLTGLITNLSTPITLSHTADTILYGEASFNTSAPTSPPTVTSITFKTGTALPAGGNLEYINVGTSPKINNVQSICRFTIAESTVTAGVPEIFICTPGAVWGKTFGADAQLSGGSATKIVNCVCLGDP